MLFIFIFLASWVGLAYLGFHYRKGGILSVGGGFIGACVMLCFVASIRNDKSAPDELRSSESSGSSSAPHRTVASRSSVERMSAETYRSEIRALYDELIGFRHSSRFLEYGFSSTGFADWKRRAEALRDSPAPDLESGTAAIHVLSLGLRYVFLKDGDDDHTRWTQSKIKEYFGKFP